MKMTCKDIGLSAAVFVASVFFQFGTGNAADASTVSGKDSGYIQLAQFRGGDRHGGRDYFCEQYAKTAVDQNSLNNRKGCGYGGDRWHSNYQKHLSWCRSVDRRDADSEAGARADDLARCDSGGGGNRDFCRSYARSAVKQNNRNKRRGCGYMDDRWHSNYQRHLRWCLTVDRSEAESQTDARDGELEVCRRGY
ncbi:MAG: hypothetical protein ACYC69_05305 [Thermodesulfovibrionales bacterium]